MRAGRLPDTPPDRAGDSGLRLPPVVPLDLRGPLAQSLRATLNGYGQPAGTMGRLDALAHHMGLALETESPALTPPHLLVFAADHGVLDESPWLAEQPSTAERVQRIVSGRSALRVLAGQLGCPLTVVDAGMATPLDSVSPAPPVHLLARKIGFGSRNMARGSAMTGEQTLAAVRAGMDLVHHIPGQVIGLGVTSAGAEFSASLILSRLCAVSLEETLPDADRMASDTDRDRLLRLLFEVMRKHRSAVKPLALLAAVGGFDLAMLVGAIIQAASERRLILMDGYLTGAAALLARELRPAVADYLVFSHRAAEHRHRLMLIHLQAEPLLDLQLHTEDGTAPLLAWPLLRAASVLLEPTADLGAWLSEK